MIRTSTYPFTRKSILYCLIFLLSVFQTVIGQAPVVSSFSPQSGPVGTTVTISGANFSATANENIVFFGAVQATVTVASATSLTVTVPVGATYQPISVLNGATVLVGYSVTSFNTTFTPSKGNITTDDISALVGYADAGTAVNIVLGDFNGDGKVDMGTLTNNAGGGGFTRVSFHQNNAVSGIIDANSFLIKQDLNPGAASPYGIAIGDLNGDGKPDIAVTSSTSNNVTICLNSSTLSTISFNVQATRYATGTTPFGIAIRDIDGDGKPDIVTANKGAASISVFRNTSTGIGNVSFDAKVDFVTGTDPVAVAIGDLDGDGLGDVVTANSTAGTISVYHNTSVIGIVSFGTQQTFATGTTPYDVTIGDLNNDGKADIVVPNKDSSTVSVFKNISSGIGNTDFETKVDFPTNANPDGIAMGDLDGDGNPDLAIATRNAVNNFISILRNTSSSGGAISFNTKTDFISIANTYNIAIGDMDGDGKNDVITPNFGQGSTTVFRNNPLFAPTVQATNVILSATTGTTTTASWTNGNGSSRAVFMFAGASGSPLPVNYTTYIANPAFSTGTQIGTSGWYCVYNGTGTTVNVTGLSPAATYQVMTVEYNGSLGNELYLSTVATGNPAGVTTLNNVATLNNLSISQGTLTPVFATATTSYSAAVPNNITNLTITPVTTDSNATVTVNGVVVTSGSASGAIALAVGPNIINTIVTAQDGTTIGTYTITVTRNIPAPVISSFSPQSGPVGTTVTISGANFSATANENIVFFGATQAIVTAATTTSLTVTVPNGANYQPIAVLNGATVLVGYSSSPFNTTFTPNKGNITTDDIMGYVGFPAAGTALNIVLGDFNGDGKVDMATLTNSTGGAGVTRVSVYKNNSTSGVINNATFLTKQDLLIASVNPFGLAIGDLDGDGKLDLAVTSANTNNVEICLNTSTLSTVSFNIQAVRYAAGTTTLGVAIQDIDGDGKLDLVTANKTAASISVLRNISTGVGNINFSPKLDFPTGTDPVFLAIGDLDGDGLGDVVTANSTAGTISVYQNTSVSGNVIFGTQRTFATGTTPYDVAIGDLNNDGKADIVVANKDSSSISTFKNTSSGIGNIGFDPKVDFPANTNPDGIAIGDLDGDGIPDLAIATRNATNNFISIYRNLSPSGGAISFKPKVDIIARPNSYKIAIGDIDGDGKNDIALPNFTFGNVSVYRNNPILTPTVQATNVIFTNTTGTTTTASWTNGNGTSRAVFMYLGSSGSPVPVDYTTYTANAAFSTGTQIATTGWYCVYNGTGSTVNITGLVPGTTYQVMTVEYNGSLSNELYLSTISTGNPAGVTTLNNVATLSNLSISEGILTPVFATATISYSATVPNATTSLTLTPVTTDTNATVTVNGVAVISGSASGTIALAVGPNVITTIVTAQDGTTISTYTVTVTRTAPPTIVTTGTLSALTTSYGTASASGTFNISGTDMLEGILVTAPTGFEVSSDNINFTNTIIVSGTGVIASTPIYIRLLGNIPVGTYSGDVVLTSNSAATVNLPTVLSIVTPVALTITADNQTKAYADANPTLTASYSGFVNGDTSASFTTPPVITTTADGTSPVGNYPITASGAVNPNYTISYVAGNLTVTSVALTITADNHTKTYGDSNPTLTVSYTGFVNGDTSASLTTPPAITTTADGTSPVGTYSITASGAVNPNYTISYVAGTLIINPANLAILADNKTKSYGDVNPTLTVTYTGFVNGDTAASLTTLPTITTTASTGSPVGIYPITVSGAVSSNYTIGYTTGQTLTIISVPLTITADNQTKAYADANPALTVSYTGFVNGDTSASLTTPPVITTTADGTSPVGTYPISASGAVNPNYTISYVDGTLSVTPVVLTITADNQTKAYADANPALTVSYSGFVNGDTVASFTTPPTITTTADGTSPVGTYPITASGAVNPNYTINYVAGTLTVTPANLTITADNKIKAYADANPTLTVSYTGFVNGDTSASLTTPPTITTTADGTSPVGTYLITASGVVNSNYTISYVDLTLTVTPVVLTITADNQTKAYADANPTLTVSYTGFVNGDTSASLTTPPAITTTADGTSPVGTYPITASGAVNPNYTISYVDGTLTVTPVVLTITAENKTKAYADANPILTVSYSGFVNGDTVASLITPPAITTTADGTSPVGTYPITASGAVSPNYTISYVAGTLTVTPVVLTITANNQTKAYADANPTLTVSYTGFVNGDTSASLTTPPAITTTSTTASPVGTYPISASGAVNPNYTISYVDGTLTVTSVVLTITANNQTKAYADANPTLTVSYAGFVNGDTSASLTTPPAITTTADGTSPVGTYPISASGAVNPNYTINYVAGTLTVTSALLTITADNQNKVYGDVNPTLTVSYSGFVNGDTAASLATLPIISTTAVTGSAVGTYPIIASGAISSNYTISYVDGTLSVTSATLLTIIANNQSKVYGDVNPLLTVTYVGFVNGDTETSLTTLPTITTTAVQNSPVGTYPVTAIGASTTNYTVVYVAGTLTVTPANLTITADNQNKIYGDANPTLTASYTGFVNGDTSASLTTPPTIVTTATTASSVGTYPISASGAVNPNYTISYVDGNLTITSAILTITVDNQSKIYGDANPSLTASYTGFVNGDTSASFTTQPTITTTATIGSSVGTYPISASGAVNPNYTISYVDGNLTITSAILTITADNQSKIYGDTNPTLTASYTGFVNGDTSASLTTLPTIVTTATTASPVGTYPIVANGALNSNYVISYVDGNLTITTAILTITADNQSKIYGNVNPTLTASYSGFVNGDTSASLTTPPTITTTATIGSSVGIYPISASGAVNTNYAISYVDGNLTVTTAILTITADNQSKIYGDTNPTLTASYTGFVNGDTAASLTTPPTIVTTATTGSSVGIYPISASGAVNSNYAINYVDGNLTITTAILTITADNQSKVYGEANPTLTASYTGFVNGDTSASLTTPPTITTTATIASPVGTYPISASGAVNPNYTISYVDGNLTITSAILTITADNQSKIYGKVNPALTASYTGFVNGDTSASLTTQPTITTSAVVSSDVGTYPITINGAVNSNYVISYVNGNLAVTTASLTITADNKTRPSGVANPALTASYAGFVNGDTAASLTTPPIIATIANTTSPAGVYAITVNDAADSNYSITYVTGILTVTSAIDVNLASLTINNGSLNPAFSPNVLSYNATVANNITTETITVIADDPLATITINGIVVQSGTPRTISLAPGTNSVAIKIVGEDGTTTKTYTINITRESADIATLSNLAISNGVLNPVFESDLTNYNAVVKYDVNSITVTPTVTDSGSKVTVNGISVASGTASAPIILIAGYNTIQTVVTAQDGITKQTYTIVVHKAISPESLVVTNILSPNGDGKNDFWEIQDILLYPNNKVTVFDRAGRIIYSKNGYSNEWEGSYSGSPLNNDTYYYLIELGDDIPRIKGFISIIRD